MPCFGVGASFRYEGGRATEQVQWPADARVAPLPAIAVDGLGERYLMNRAGTILAVEPR